MIEEICLSHVKQRIKDLRDEARKFHKEMLNQRFSNKHTIQHMKDADVYYSKCLRILEEGLG